mgnify:CR=1 FL=1
MWQAVYEDLRDSGLEIIAVAFDTGGKAAVEASIRAEGCRERPDVLARLMGWSPELWARQAPPTYTCLIDEGHLLAERYGMVNVPQGVWIDEAGRIVRAPESAGTIDMVRHMNRETFEIPDAPVAAGMAARDAYVAALKDWAANGAASRYVLPAAEVRKRLRGPGEAEAVAANHVRLGRFLFARGALEAAKRHFSEASRLHPDSWNYRRQSMMLDPASIGQLNAGPDFWAAVDARSDRPFYPPAELGPAA